MEENGIINDILSFIFTYLPMNDIYHCMQVSKQYHESTQSSYLWGYLLDNKFGNDYKNLIEDTLYETYKKCYVLTKSNIKLNLEELNRLQTIHLNQKKLTTPIKGIHKLKNLKMLYLDHNQMTTISKEIFTLNNLENLYLYNNNLTVIPTEIGMLTKLQTLYLNNNQITVLPNEICNLINLKVLHIHHNQLITLPEQIGKLTNLEQLYASYNQLTTIPISITKLKKLTALYLRNNQLTTIPEKFCKFERLAIQLSGNQLIDIPKGCSHMINLSEDLSYKPKYVQKDNDKPEKIKSVNNDDDYDMFDLFG